MSRAIIEIPAPSAYFNRALAVAELADADERPPEADYHLGFANTAHLFGELSPARLTILEVLKVRGPLSATTLAQHLRRHEKGVQGDVTALLELNLLAQDQAGLLSVPWDTVEVHLAFQGADAAA